MILNIIPYKLLKFYFDAMHEMTTSVRFCLSYDALKWDFIFRMGFYRL